MVAVVAVRGGVWWLAVIGYRAMGQFCQNFGIFYFEIANASFQCFFARPSCPTCETIFSGLAFAFAIWSEGE